LKNGSVLKGKVASFADDQFIVMLDTGSGRYLSRAMVYMGDVARIEFDAGSGTGDSSAVTQPSETPARTITETPERETPRETPRETARREGKKANPGGETPVKSSPPADPPVRETAPPDTTPPPVREPEPQPEKPAITNPSPSTTAGSESAEGERLTRKPLVPIKTVTVDVVARKDWTSSGLIVKRGDHLRVSATGTITLDPATGRTSGPEGVELVDAKKLMPDQPTGALIAVISSDNDDFIFLGKAGEFTATRDGLLFLSVNEGMLSDNVGTFKAVVEVLAQRK